MVEKVKVADYIASYIADTGIGDVFMIVGGGAMHLNEAFGSHPKIRYYCHHHEQAAAIAAEAYARLKGLGVCSVTTGPGGTNTLTGVAGAWLDSIPMLIISGQVKRETLIGNTGLRELGVQELNIIDIVKPITKYAVLVEKPEDIKYHLQKAIFLATSGRPGPAWLDIPLDIQAAHINVNNLRSFNQREIGKMFDYKLVKRQVTQTLKLLKRAKRPVILAGGGIRLAGAHDVFLKLVEKLSIPVLTAMSSHDLIYSSHRLFLGRPGVFGERVGNFIIQNSDLLISIGSRLHLWIISYDYKNFARAARKVVVDIDKAELQKPTIKPDIPIHSDAKVFIEEILRQSEKVTLPKFKKWIAYCERLKKKYSVVLPEYKREKKFVNSYYFTEVLSKLLKEDEVIVTGNGTAFTGTLQCIKLKRRQRLISNVGCASMGYGLPAAIGACIANNKKRVICITGDGSIQMNIQELQTVVHHQLPIKIFLLNNNGYLTIRSTQDAYFKSHYVGSNPESGVSCPDMLKIAKAYGIPARRIKNHKNLQKKIKSALETTGPFICELMMNPKQPLIPKVTSYVRPDGKVISKPVEDMYPFLDREEFYENMIIEPIKED